MSSLFRSVGLKVSALPEAASELVLEKVRNDPDVLAVFAHGSRIEGFANKFSDLDTCVITKKQRRVEFSETTDKSIGIDIQFLPLQELQSTIETAERILVKKTVKDFRGPDMSAVLWCHRIKTGIPVVDNGLVFRKLQASIPSALSGALVSYYSGLTVDYVNDGLGSMESGDFETALLATRIGVDMAAMAYLASTGVINPKVKWIYRYLSRMKGDKNDAIASDYMNLQRLCAWSHNEVKLHVERSTRFIQKIVELAQSPKISRPKG